MASVYVLPAAGGHGAATLKRMGFDGLRVTAFETRRATEMAELIRRQGGEPFVAPALRERPLEENPDVFAFAERLFAGEFEAMILLTGVGTRALRDVIASRYGPERFPEALRRIVIVARGPKPVAALREMNLTPTLTAPEPNTSQEVLGVLAGRPERKFAVQEYGRPNPELLESLRQRGAEVTRVPVYRYDLPENTAPLREAARRIAGGQTDVALFTTATQCEHLFRIATEDRNQDAVLGGLKAMMLASIGPTTTEALLEHDVHPDMEPSHPKMGLLVKEAAEQAAAILARKRAT